MPISFGSGSGGGGGAYLRVNMPQNRWTFVGEEQEPVDMGKGVAMDMKNITLGWLLLATGQRDWQPFVNDVETAKPGDDYKKGFELNAWLSDGRHCTFSGNSYGQTSFIERVYAECEKAAEFSSKVPVLSVTASTPIAIGKGTSYQLEYSIKAWIERPEIAAPDAAPPSAAPAAADNNFGF